MGVKSSFTALGKIVKPHGVKGAVQVYPGSDGGLLLETDTVYIQSDQGHYVPFHVLWARLKKKHVLLMGFEEINTRTDAENLAGHRVFVDASTLPPPEPENFYHFQLRGMRVHDPALNFNGRIQEILDAGGNRVLVVKDKDDREVMIPAVKEFIKEIDSTAHLCIVNIPKGLLELNHA